ncbi:MAG TPA: M56 family metallopeptidase [Bryobacteraceae bacterium]|jgi:beta-lactamase regulating signal transducer with metallopeptidase domain
MISIQSTAILALALIIVALSRRARASVRHLVLEAAFVGLMCMPISVNSPVRIPVHVSLPVHVSMVQSAPPLPHASGLAQSASPDIPWDAVLLAVWMSGFVAFVVWLAIDLVRLRRIRREGLPCPELSSEGIQVLLHEKIQAPLTFGIIRHSIILPVTARTWSEAELRHALVHEMAHIQRRDWILLLFAQWACAIYWFNPLVWIARRRLCLEAEMACDDAVLKDHEPSGYARQLVALAEEMSHARPRLALGMAKRSDLSIRVSALLDTRRRRGGTGWRASLLAIAATTLVVFALAPERAVALSRSDDSALLEAAQRGDVAAITSLLKAGAHVNASIGGDGSPLIAAARAGQSQAVRLLLDRGADPNMAVRGDGCPLIAAAASGYPDIVALLLDRGAWVDQIVPDDEDALIQASSGGHLSVVKLLVGRGANPNARVWAEGGIRRPGEWRTPLSMALRRKHEDVAVFLQASGAHE